MSLCLSYHHYPPLTNVHTEGPHTPATARTMPVTAMPYVQIMSVMSLLIMLFPLPGRPSVPLLYLEHSIVLRGPTQMSLLRETLSGAPPPCTELFLPSAGSRYLQSQS